MSRSDAWMPLYVGDYLADTGHLRALSHGAYVLLILHYWRKGPLPDDDESLSAIARTDRDEWARIGGTVRAFFVAEDGVLRHKRIDAERERAARISAKRAAAGAEGARKTNGNRGGKKSANAAANAEDLPQPGRVHSQSHDSSFLRKEAGGSGLFGDLPQDGPATMRAALFRDGLPILRALTGKSEAQCRATLGGLLKTAQDDCARLYSLLREAESLVPADPLAWLNGALRTKGQGPDRRGRTDWAMQRMREMAGHGE